MYNLIWLYAVSWVFLVAVTVGENNFQIASGYLIVIYNASAFVALSISYVELFALPKKSVYVEHVSRADDQIERRSERRASQSSRSLLGEGSSRPSRAAEDSEATERTALLGGSDNRASNTFTKFAKKLRSGDDDALDETDDKLLNKAYGDEQGWSSSLPKWAWVIQFIILVPINVIIVGQTALLLTAALSQ